MQSPMVIRSDEIAFIKLPYFIKEELAMHLDSPTDQNWKRLAEALKCPVFQIMAFQERAYYTKEASPSLIFFDQFCDSISVKQFRSACSEIQNISCVEVLDSYFENDKEPDDSSYGNDNINYSMLQKRMQDFDDLPQDSTGVESCKIVSLSRGIFRNRHGLDSLDFSYSKSFISEKTDNMDPSMSRTNIKASDSVDNCSHSSVFITFSAHERNMDVVLNICKFLRKNYVTVSLDTDAKDVKGKPIEDWIKEKFESVDSVIVIATPSYKAITKSKAAWWKKCFSNPQLPNPNETDSYHIPLIYSLMVAEHEKSTKNIKVQKSRKRFVTLIPSGSSKKDVPKWLQSSYPLFVWPNHYQAFLLYLLGDISKLHKTT